MRHLTVPRLPGIKYVSLGCSHNFVSPTASLSATFQWQTIDAILLAKLSVYCVWTSKGISEIWKLYVIYRDNYI